MKQDDTRTISTFYVEPDDEKQSIFNILSNQYGNKSGIVLVLTGQSTKAFQSPKDFHDLKLLKRQGDLPIIFVIPKGSLAQWATMNGFIVHSSLEAFDRSTSIKATRRSTSSLVENNATNFPDPPTSYSLPINPLSIKTNYPLSSPDLATPTPEHNLQFSSLFTSDSPLSGPLPEDPAEDIPPAPSPHKKHLATESLVPPTPPKKSQKNRSYLIILTIVVIISALSASLLFSQRDRPASSPASSGANPVTSTIGNLYFFGSGQLGQMGDNGVNDEVKLVLSHLSPPASGKSYYAWLQGDANVSDGGVIMLGKLQIVKGNASLTYIDARHNDMLATMSRFLVTEEDSTTQPIVPSPDTSTWKYDGEISQKPAPNDQNHFSVLNHLRHLLAAEPSLETRGLHGGLALWLYRNTGKLLEWSRNAQDGWGNESASPLMKRQIIRVMDYLDGVGDVGRDVPPQTPIMTDTTQGSVGLLQIHADQNPASYMQQIGYHITSLIEAPGVSKSQIQNTIKINMALNTVRGRLQQARQDCQQLVALNDEQLQSPKARALLDDLVTQITDAYAGTDDLATNTREYGVVWIYENMHSLAIIDVHASGKTR